MKVRNPEVLESTAKFPTVKDLTNGEVFKFVTGRTNALFIYSGTYESITDLTDGEVYHDDSEPDGIVPSNWLEAPIVPVECEIVIKDGTENTTATTADYNVVSGGIIRRFDDLGRICIPKEFRRKFQLQEGDPIEISITNDAIILKKC